MKIWIKEDRTAKEMEVRIVCKKRDAAVEALARQIGRAAGTVEGLWEQRVYQLPLQSIYYAESVDGKTFLYTGEKVFLAKESLLTLERRVGQSGFARISKSCLVNLNYLNCVAPYANHRLLAELENGECLIVGRTYIDQLKTKLKGDRL